MRAETEADKIQSEELLHGFDKAVEVELEREKDGSRKKDRDSNEMIEGMKAAIAVSRAAEKERKSRE